MDVNIRGLSTLAFFTVPAVLGIAAIYWLVFVRGVMEVRHGIIMDSRHNEIVGAKVLPRGAIQMVIAGTEPGMVNIERAEIYGSDLTVWVRNDGDKPRGSLEDGTIAVVWKAMSPDGTVVNSGHEFCSWNVSISPMQVSECRFSINANRRMQRLEVSVERPRY